MRKTLVAIALALPLSTFAAAIGAPTLVGSRSAKSVCASGTCDAPVAATLGMSLDSVATLDVIVCADSGQTITDGASFDVYFYDPDVALWAKSDLALTVPTGGRCGYARGDSPGKGIPILGERGRVAVIPNAAAVSSGSVTVYTLATDARGQDL